MLAVACDGGSSDATVVPTVARNPTVRLARYLDANDDGIANQGDHLVVVFGEPVLLAGAMPEDFVPMVLGDRLGGGAVVLGGPGPGEATVILGTGPVLRTRGQHIGTGTLADLLPNAPSGIDVGEDLAPGVIVNAETGETAMADHPVDVVPGLIRGDSTSFDVPHLDAVVADVNQDDFDDVVATRGGGFRVYFGRGDGRFDAFDYGSLGTGTARTIAVGDVTKDGLVDVVVGRDGDDEVWEAVIPKSPQSLAFLLLATLHDSEGTRALELFDADRDGDLDVAVAADDSVRLYRNVGQAFAEGVELSGTTRARDLAAADFDRDGDLDLLVAEDGPSHVLVNDGEGGFTTGASIGSSTTLAVDVGDVNADGIPDVIEGNEGADELWFGQHSGAFVAVGGFTELGSTRDVVLVDLDADTRLDLVIARDDEVRALFNDRTGLLIDAGQSLPARGVAALATGDLDGDFDVDVLAAGSDPPIAYDGSLAGTWGTTRFRQSLDEYATGPTFAFVTADLDRDGDLDLVRAGIGAIEVRSNMGLGQFGTAVELSTPGTSVHELAVADVDRDGDLDLLPAAVGPSGFLWLNDGDGGFELQAATGGDPVQATSIDVADLDCDGDVDVVLGSRFGLSKHILYNLGNDAFGWRGFGAPVSLTSTTGADELSMNDIALADLDGDGFPDLVTGHGPLEPVRLWFNQGNGALVEGPRAVDARDVRSLAVGDLDRDGDLDLVTAATGGEGVWHNDAGGGFGLVQELDLPDARAVRLLDADGDGYLDVIVGAAAQQGMGFWRNGGGGTFPFPPKIPFLPLSIESLRAADLDADGDPELVVGQSGFETDRVWLNR